MGIRFSNAVYQLSYNIFILGALMKFKINNEACTSFKIEKIKLPSASGLRQTPWRAGRSEQNDNHGGGVGNIFATPDPALSGSRLCVLFLLQKTAHCCKIYPVSRRLIQRGKNSENEVGVSPSPALPFSPSPPVDFSSPLLQSPPPPVSGCTALIDCYFLSPQPG